MSYISFKKELGDFRIDDAVRVVEKRKKKSKSKLGHAPVLCPSCLKKITSVSCFVLGC
jgi:hypothetical protein